MLGVGVYFFYYFDLDFGFGLFRGLPRAWAWLSKKWGVGFWYKSVREKKYKSSVEILIFGKKWCGWFFLVFEKCYRERRDKEKVAIKSRFEPKKFF